VKDPRKLRAFVVAARRAAGESDEALITELGVHDLLHLEGGEGNDGTERVEESQSPYDWEGDT
jgi:hypothetical protein